MRKTRDTACAAKKPAITFVYNGILGAIVNVLLLILFAFLIAKEVLPEGAMDVIPASAAFIAALIAAFKSSKALGRTMLTSLIQGAVNIAIFYIGGLAVFMRVVPASMNLYVFLGCVAGAVLGGLLAAGGK
ncbi:MAG: hypothetical protein RSA70_05425 [Clostridia bacterium]